MRTADRFIARQWAFPLGATEAREFMEQFVDVVRNVPIVVADNVAHYVNARSAAVCLEGYPSLAPPWPKFWIEYPSSSGQQRRGVMVLDTTEHMDTPLPAHIDEGQLHVPQLAAGAKAHAIEGGALPEDVRWVITLGLFIEQDKTVWGPAGCLCLALDHSGQVVGNRWSIAPVMLLNKATQELIDEVDGEPADAPINLPTEEQLQAMSDEEVDQLTAELRERLAQLDGKIEQGRKLREKAVTAVPVLKHLSDLGARDAETAENVEWLLFALAAAMQTIAFLHCKNVMVDQVTPDAKVQAKRRKKGQRPLVRYHTLRLEVPRRAGGGGGGGARFDDTAMHIVPGHFAHYGECCSNHPPKGKLFGRLTGVFWVPTHARGNSTVGEVHTDYEPVLRKGA